MKTMTKEEVFKRFGVKEGMRIRIEELYDPYDNTYSGRTGEITHIDAIGQLHGTWGGLAIIPQEDKIKIL